MLIYTWACCCSYSETKLCSSLCDPRDCSTPGSSVLYYLPEFAQIHVHWVGDAIQPSHPLLPPFSSCPQSFQASGSFWMSQFFTSGGQSVGASVSATALPVNIQGWFPSGLIGWTPCSPRDSQESPPALQFKSINSSVLNLLYFPILTSVHDRWKKHSFDHTDLCRQNDVSAF